MSIFSSSLAYTPCIFQSISVFSPYLKAPQAPPCRPERPRFITAVCNVVFLRKVHQPCEGVWASVSDLRPCAPRVFGWPGLTAVSPLPCVSFEDFYHPAEPWTFFGAIVKSKLPPPPPPSICYQREPPSLSAPEVLLQFFSLLRGFPNGSFFGLQVIIFLFRGLWDSDSSGGGFLGNPYLVQENIDKNSGVPFPKPPVSPPLGVSYFPPLAKLSVVCRDFFNYLFRMRYFTLCTLA